MPIKKRFTHSGDFTFDDPRKRPNITKSDQYSGSSYDKLGIPKDKAASIIGAMTYIEAHNDTAILPHEQYTQDLLAQLRISHNNSDLEDRYRERIRSPLTGVRGYCVTQCEAGGVKAVSECGSVDCPLWAFRMGQNGFR